MYVYRNKWRKYNAQEATGPTRPSSAGIISRMANISIEHLKYRKKHTPKTEESDRGTKTGLAPFPFPLFSIRIAQTNLHNSPKRLPNTPQSSSSKSLIEELCLLGCYAVWLL
jgi:hypothetical protein